MLLCIAGCGFQLRGVVPLPKDLHTLSIKPDDPYEPFQRELRRNLVKNKVNVLGSDTKLQHNVLVLTKQSINDEVIGYSPSGQPQKIRVIYTVGYKLLDNKGNTLIENNTLSRSRELNRNTQVLLSSNRERQNIIRELNNEVVHALLRQLAKS